jgi:outer membrane lipoprotein SlyB
MLTVVIVAVLGVVAVYSLADSEDGIGEIGGGILGLWVGAMVGFMVAIIIGGIADYVVVTDRDAPTVKYADGSHFKTERGRYIFLVKNGEEVNAESIPSDRILFTMNKGVNILKSHHQECVTPWVSWFAIKSPEFSSPRFTFNMVN